MKFPIAAYCLSLLAAMPTATTAKEGHQQRQRLRILEDADASLSMAAIGNGDWGHWWGDLQDADASMSMAAIGVGDWWGGGGW